jgi:hypothetical protein
MITGIAEQTPPFVEFVLHRYWIEAYDSLNEGVPRRGTQLDRAGILHGTVLPGE